MAVLSGDEHHLFLKFVAVIILMGAIVGVSAQFGEIVAVVVAGFVTVAMPACLMILAVEKSGGRAINPMAQLRLMLAVGSPALLPWAGTQHISAGPVYLGGGLV